MPEQDTFQTSCPSCGAKYSLPREYIGQKAECSECKTEFIISGPPSENSTPASAPNHCSVKPGGDTSTTKIPRISGTVSMLPQIDDPFKLSVVQTVGPTSKTKPAVSLNEPADADSAKKKSRWKFWK